MRIATWPIWLVLILTSALTACNYLLMLWQCATNRPDPDSGAVVETAD